MAPMKSRSASKTSETKVLEWAAIEDRLKAMPDYTRGEEYQASGGQRNQS